jgi:serine/threonine-protein kinase
MAACLDRAVRPTPSALGAQVSDAVERVFARALALDPRERYRRVDDFWRELCDAAQVLGPLPTIEWKAWAGARDAEGALGAGTPLNAAKPTAVPAGDWMHAETAPMVAVAALPRALSARQPGRGRLYAGIAGVCLLVLAIAAPYFLRHHRPRAVMANARRIIGEDTASSTPPMPVMAVSIAPAAAGRAAPPPPEDPASVSPAQTLPVGRPGRPPIRHAHSHGSVAPILRMGDTSTAVAVPVPEVAATQPLQSGDPAATPSTPDAAPTISPESLLKHDALVRRK